MINEERLCMACHLPIEDMRKAMMVPDNGTNQTYHRACLEAMVGEPPTPDEPVASGVWAGQRPLVHIRGAIGYEDGKPIYEHELVSKADVPEYGASQCVLCHRPVSGDENVVRSRDHVAHQECVRVLLAFVNQPEQPTAPVRPTTPVQKASASKQAVDERLGREDALFLVHTLAEMIRQSNE